MPKVLNVRLQIAVGRRITKIREERGLSKYVVARKLGLTWHQLNKYETGVNCPPLSRIIDMAELFAVQPCEICGFHNN